MSFLSEAHPWTSQPSTFGAVALAASAGGLPAFRTVLSRLPSDFPIPVLIVQHRIPRSDDEDILVTLLQRCVKLRVIQAKHGALLEPGTVYVSPPSRSSL